MDATMETDHDVKHARYLKLYKAATCGDWTTAKRIFDEDPDALTAPLPHWNLSVLHVAVASSHSNSMSFLRKLVDLMVQQGKSLAPRNNQGRTPLHFAAKAGNIKAARLLVEKDLTLARNLNDTEDAPLYVAAFYKHEETVRYLLPVTIRVRPRLLDGSNVATFLVALIMDGFYDLAFEVLELYPRLSIEEARNGATALFALAQQPQAFQSGIRLTFWQHLLLYVWERMFDSKTESSQQTDVENPAVGELEFNLESVPLFQPFKKVHDEKLKQKYVLKLLKSLVDKASKLEEAADVFGPASRMAARNGIVEIVVQVIKAYPQAVVMEDLEGRNIFNLAVIYRQEKIFNLIFQLDSWKHFDLGIDNKYSDTMLHQVVKHQRVPKIREIPGAALQMQRELQWYKEVEKFATPSYQIALQNESITADYMMFIDSHQELINRGEKWMKGTANYYIIVAALVVTITFAAAFTAPGGNNDNTGIPVSLNGMAFMFFAVADALSFFSSTTSLLMFLGVLTSRYVPEDFLKRLPTMLVIGLITLFFSIASMLVAFTAAMHIMLSHRVSWIIVPIGSLACLPFSLFVFHQFPLLQQVLYSTFGPSIGKKRQ